MQPYEFKHQSISNINALGLLANREINNHTANSPAFQMLLKHPDLKQTLNFTVNKNRTRLQGCLISANEAKLMAPTLLFDLVKTYEPDRGANFVTYVSNYLMFKFQAITRKSVGEENLEILGNYSRQQDVYCEHLSDQLDSKKQVDDHQISQKSKKQINNLSGDYERYSYDHLEKVSFTSPEEQFVQRRKKLLWEEVIDALVECVRTISDPIERVFKSTWIDIYLGRCKSVPIITRTDHYKVKPSQLIELAIERSKAQHIDTSEFTALSQRGKYKRITHYVDDLKSRFRALIKSMQVPEWKLKFEGSDWINRLIEEEQLEIEN